MELSFSTITVEWRGPAPFVFAAVPEEEADAIAAIAPSATYGWGCIPASARIGGTDFSASLFPRHGGYLVPVKVAVQRAEQIGVGDRVEVELRIEAR